MGVDRVFGKFIFLTTQAVVILVGYFGLGSLAEVLRAAGRPHACVPSVPLSWPCLSLPSIPPPSPLHPLPLSSLSHPLPSLPLALPQRAASDLV